MSEQILNAIEEYFDAAWAARTPVCYDNVPFIASETPEPWLKLEVYDGTVERASLGPTHLERSTGTAFFTIYVPKGEGSQEARGYVDDIIGLFRSRQEIVAGGTLTYFDAVVKRVGESYASGAGSSISSTVASTQWFSMIVSIAYGYDKVV